MTIRQDQHDTIMELRREVAHWKANHDHQVERARILMERPDLPIERVEAYKKWQECEAENARLAAENAELIELLELIDPHIGTEWVRLQLRAALAKVKESGK